MEAAESETTTVMDKQPVNKNTADNGGTTLASPPIAEPEETSPTTIQAASDSQLAVVLSGDNGVSPVAEAKVGTQLPVSVVSSSDRGSDSPKSDETPPSTEQGGKEPPQPPKRPKIDRSKLRKGKWTVEEEEYTSRIIHYFGNGLLTLPEGATLRSYLAEKLNCDPMRITKKYAGAACLGRRAHQFRERTTPSIPEIQFAKAELDHYEQRFRMRVEEGYSSLPLAPPTTESMLALSQQANHLLMNSMQPVGVARPATSNPMQTQQTSLPSWLLPLSQSPPQAPPPNPGLGQINPQLLEQAKAISNLASLGAALPWMLTNNNNNPPAPAPSVPTPAATGLQGVDSVMANLAVAQAAASLAPAIAQLLQQQQQQQVQQAHLQQPKPAAVDPIKELAARLQQSRDTESLRQALQAALARNQPSSPEMPPDQSLAQAINQASLAQNLQLAIAQQQVSNVLPHVPKSMPQQAHIQNDSTPSAPLPEEPPVITSMKRQRSDEDKQAGNILLGFLSSLRQSYEEAVKEKEAENVTTQATRPASASTTTTTTTGRLFHDGERRVPVISDFSSGVSSTTYQPESSLEDWNSDKKTETSSSEDSDKETGHTSPKGPPRKRHKSKRAPETMPTSAATATTTLTFSNLAAHSQKGASQD